MMRQTIVAFFEACADDGTIDRSVRGLTEQTHNAVTLGHDIAIMGLDKNVVANNRIFGPCVECLMQLIC